jgi:peptidoglycan/LPS O-acetylase OafA/YrhL
MITTAQHGARAVRESPRGRTSHGQSYVPGLDGLRALAIAAVVLYHADVPWMPGGFLGVEIFLVISGFLITSLLRDEYRLRGTIDITDFWLRRARRLLPAMWALIFCTALYAAYFLSDELATFRGDAIAALGYAANWVLIFDHKSYFEQAGRPSLLKHFWSLAIEQQFYLFWPGVFALVFARLPRLAASGLLLFAAGESALWMAVLFDPEVDPSRLYFGTDTRASGLLLGAALALLRPGRMFESLGQEWRAGLEALGALALGLLVAACFVVDEFEPTLYRGGFFWVALLTVMVITVVHQPGPSWLGRLLSLPPLRWLGVRSYSLYLWHFPIFMVTRPELDIALTGLPALLVRLALALFFAELSYRFVEAPVRSGALTRLWSSLLEYPAALRWSLVGGWAIAIGAVCIELASAGGRDPNAADADQLWVAKPSPVAAVSSGMIVQPSSSSRPPSASRLSVEARANEPALLRPAPLPSAATLAATRNEPGRAHGDATLATGEAATATAAAVSGRPPAPARSAEKVLAVGDSVMLGAARYLREPGVQVEVDAAVGRQVSTTVELLEQARRSRSLPGVVLIHIGNNGTFRDHQFDRMMTALADVPTVVFVNTKVPRRWQDPNNLVLTEGVLRNPRVKLIDWLSYSKDHPEWFREDGYHLQPDGATAYAALLRDYYAPTPATERVSGDVAPL